MGSQTRTRSAAAKKPEEDLIYSMNSALSQVRDEVEKVCSANSRTEKKVESLMGYLDLTEVCPLSFYLYSQH